MERQRRMVGLLVFDSILVFFDTFYFTHKVIIHHLLYNVTLLLPLHIITHSLSFDFKFQLILNFNFTCIEPREGKKQAYAAYGLFIWHIFDVHFED